MRYRTFHLALTTIIAVNGLFAADRWVLIGEAGGGGGGCAHGYLWQAVAIAHNSSDRTSSVRVVEASNGVVPSVSTMTIAPLASAAVPLLPAAPAPVFIVRLDVPDGVEIESRLEYRYLEPCRGAPPAPGPAGQTALPVFTVLRPSGTSQIHFGTDLGLQPVRVNVGIYNGGATAATARVTIRRPACSNESASTVANVAVGSKELRQVSLPPPDYCVGNGMVPPYVTYTTILADQPTLSWVTPVSNVQPPVISFGVAAGH